MPGASVCKLPGVNVSLLTDIRQMLGNEGRTCGFEPGCCLGFVSHSSPILPRPSLLPPAGSKEKKKAPEWLMVDLEENLSVPLTPPTRLYLFFHLFIFCSSVVSLHCFLVGFFFVVFLHYLVLSFITVRRKWQFSFFCFLSLLQMVALTLAHSLLSDRNKSTLVFVDGWQLSSLFSSSCLLFQDLTATETKAETDFL